MGYEIRRIIEIFIRYKWKFVVIWFCAIVFSVVFYLISPPGYKSQSLVIMENTRKPWTAFQKGALPSRYPVPEGQKSQTLSLRDPFWNFLYDQMDKSTYDFTPFFYARTTVFKIMDDVGCRHHFDNGSMSSEEIVLAFTENLDVSLDRVAGHYNIEYTFVDPAIAKAIVNRYTELFRDFINQQSLVNNLEPLGAVSENIEKLEDELLDIETRQAELKSSSGIIAPANHLSSIMGHLYATESKLIQAKSRAIASRELLFDSQKRIDAMDSYGVSQNDEMQYSILDVMSDPMLAVIMSRLFWDSINLAQAEMTYVEDTPQLKYWSDRVEISRQLFLHHLADNEKGYASDLLATLTVESAKTVWLEKHKKETQELLDKLPAIENEFIYLQRQKVSKLAMLNQFKDLKEIGESYMNKGEKIFTVLDSAYLPSKKDEPNFLKLLVMTLFISTISGFGWFFIRENIEVHSGVGD